MKVFIDPIYRGEDRADGGIRRVSDAMARYLPQYGWNVTDSPDDADLIANHGAALTERTGVPMVAICHGLMWEGYGFGQWGDSVNKAVIETMARAQAVTAPSRWVAHAVTRGMLVNPEVVYHGVDLDAWAHDLDPLGYVLWNKARVDAVSDPQDMNDVAALLPDVPFLSTFGARAPNIDLLGAVPYEQMRTVVQRASVYLATARETFGIGTLEALAAGVPVAGWRYGGQEEIVIDGETGYLAEWGDYEGLAECVRRCLAERRRLCANAQTDVSRRWRWEDKILHYAMLFDRVVKEYRTPRPKVSVIVTAHNLAKYLSSALDSVMQQTMTDWECIIVDDQSTDNTAQIAKMYCDGVAKPHPQANMGNATMRYLRTPSNLKLSGARNYGWQHSTGRYVLFLDADDALTPNALDLLSTALDRRTDVHIAFGHLDTVDDRGNNRQRNPWPGDRFDWHGQIAHLNQTHYSAMLRREVLERSGGFRPRDWRAEDASFWSRVTSLGFRAAKVTEDATLIYRLRSDSKSRGEDGDGDWTAWLPWRLAGNPHEGMEASRQKRQPNPYLVPFGAQGKPPAPRKAWPVWHHQEPAVSIIVPVGPGHARYLVDALDSVQAQTFPFWEAIVVNDTGDALDTVAHPWARVIDGGSLGAGAARNRGIAAARAPLSLFLDADDLLPPRALEAMVATFVLNDGRYVYGDWLHLEDEGKWDARAAVHQVPEYDPRLWLEGAQHAVTCLVETEQARRVGGFDEQLPAWEDWDFLIKLAVNGICGVRVPEPTLIYRLESGQRRKVGDAKERELLAAIRDRYAGYATGEIDMAGCCGGGKAASTQAQSAIDMMYGVFGVEEGTAPLPDDGPVRMEFVGDTWGAMTWISEDRQRQYRAGRDPNERYIDVAPADVAYLERLGLFRVVTLPPEPVVDAPEEAVVVAAPVESVTRRQRGRRA